MAEPMVASRPQRVSVQTTHAVVISRAEKIGGAAVGLFGLALRLPGLTSGDLWADDAWLAMAARVPLREVSHVTLTTPLLSYFLAGWIRLDPSPSWWAQLPGLVMGVAAIFVVWRLAAEIGVGVFARLAVALMAASSPGAIEYSMRVKEYPSELLIGALLLLALARWRRTRHRTPLIWLGVGGVLACFWSGSLVAEVGVIAVVVMVSGRRQREAIVVAGALLVACATAALTFLSRLPPSLNIFWAPQEIQHLGVASSTSRNLALIGNGVAHGLVGVPLLVGKFPLVLALSPHQVRLGHLQAAVEVLCLSLAAFVVVVTRRRREPAATIGVTSLGIIGAALAGALLGKAPLGGVRTDLWWYPAAWVLSALVLDAMARRLTTRGAPPLLVQAVGVTTLLGIAAVGLAFPAWYPTTDLRGVIAAIGRPLGPHDAVLVAGRIPFTWAYDGVGPFQIDHDHGVHRMTNGYGVSVSRPPDVRQEIISSPASMCQRFTAIFIVTSDNSLASPSAYRLPTPTQSHLNAAHAAAKTTLLNHGWTVTSTRRRAGVVATELRHNGLCSLPNEGATKLSGVASS